MWEMGETDGRLTNCTGWADGEERREGKKERGGEGEGVGVGEEA